MSDQEWSVYRDDKLLRRFSHHFKAVSFVREELAGETVRIVGPNRDYEMRWKYLPDDAWAGEQ